LVRDEKKKAGIYSLQWGGGRHVCMGTRFAMMQIYLVLHQLFSKYTLTKVTEEVEMRKNQLGTIGKPAGPVYIKVVEKKTLVP
jgi:cytochrome P450